MFEDFTAPNESLALVVVDGPRVVLFQWVVQLTNGRVADIDEHNKVIMIVPVGSKRHPIKPLQVVLPSTGVVLERVKKKERPQVPPKLSRLIRSLECSLQHVEVETVDSRADVSDHLPCFICKEVLDESSLFPFTCPMCLCTGHDACVEKWVLKPLLEHISLAQKSGVHFECHASWMDFLRSVPRRHVRRCPSKLFCRVESFGRKKRTTFSQPPFLPFKFSFQGESSEQS